MTDFEVKTAAGRVLLLTDDLGLALRRTRELRKIYPGVYVEEVTRIEKRKVIYRTKVQKVEKAA